MIEKPNTDLSEKQDVSLALKDEPSEGEHGRRRRWLVLGCIVLFGVLASIGARAYVRHVHSGASAQKAPPPIPVIAAEALGGGWDTSQLPTASQVARQSPASDKGGQE